MNTRPLLIVLAALATSLLHAQSPVDPIGGNLFPPDFIMANANAINFTDEQRQTLRDTVEKNQERFSGLHQALKQEADALGKLLAQPASTEAAVLAQFDKVQDREREIKRAQLALMLGIRGKLTEDQRAKLTELRAKNPGQQPPPEFAAKMEHIKAGIARWQSEGRDPSPIGQMMQQFEPLMRSGQIEPANALLDQAIKALESGGQ
jgi:Spy/CpxP family protein refolding chaperone